MSERQHLHGTEAVKLLKEIVDHQGACLMITRPQEDPPTSRPMGVAEVDEQGNFWFITLLHSDKCDHVAGDPRVHLHFMNPKAQEYLSVYGRAQIVDDRERVKKLFNPLAKAWVPEGSDNPDLRLLKVSPDECAYWDTKDGTVVAAVKILVAAMGVNTNDGGVEGKLRP